MVTLTPGSGAPEESLTVPTIVPVVTCPFAESKPTNERPNRAKNAITARSPEMPRQTFTAYSPPKPPECTPGVRQDRKSTRLNSSHLVISYAVFCLKKKKKK